MEISTCLFWNVDTQNDFVSPKGKLYVQGAELIIPKWERITQLAKDNSIRVVNTADFHLKNSVELSDSPDFINTFPAHCMAFTKGADFVLETKPENALIVDWTQASFTKEDLLNSRNIVIRKDAFDVFAGNPESNRILDLLKPETVVVYGLTTNVCVDFAVKGLAKRVKNIVVIKDAIKELPNIPLPFKNWEKLGIKLIHLKELEIMLD